MLPNVYDVLDIIGTPSVITKYYYELLEMLKYTKVEKGHINDFNKKRHGILVVDEKSNIYNFYEYKQFNRILDFAKYMQDLKYRVFTLEKLRKSFSNDVTNVGVCLYYLDFFPIVIHRVDSILSHCQLHPIFSQLIGYGKENNVKIMIT